nr:reverse transcriptase domain-containing protein [Tanacetum cinerariifolium]
MRTRSNFYPSNSTANIPKRSNRRRIPNIVEPKIRTIAEIIPMEDRTMEELLQAPTEGYGEAIVILEILAKNFEIKTNLIQLVQANKFQGRENDNPHTHISNFKRMTATLKYRDVPNDAINLMLFLYLLEDRDRIYEAWDRFKEFLRACPHHGFSELTQIDTFYNGLTEQDQDSLNATSGGNLLNKTNREALQIIENKSKVCYLRSKSNVSRVNMNSRDVVSKTDDRIDKLADQISNLVEIINKQVIAPAKAVEETCVTCGGAHAYYKCIATDSNPSSVCAGTGSYNQVSPPNRASHQIPPPGFGPVQNNPNSFFQNQPLTSGTLLSNTVPNPKGEMKAVTTRSGLAYEGSSIPTESSLEKVDEQNTEEMLDKEHSNSLGSIAQIQPLVMPVSIPKPDVPRTRSKPSIPYPSRLNDQKLREKATNQMEFFFQIFHDLHFDISFADALLLMPKLASTINSLLANKDKLFELANVTLNENCSATLLKKLPEKLGDLGKFLIPCDFPGMEVCHALTDLGASINLMPLSIWKKLSLPKLTPTRMTLELADRSITRPKGVAKDVFVKVGKFHFPIDFIVVDFKADPRVPLILRRSFLRTGRALIDVYGEEITLRYNPKSSNPTLVSDYLISESDACKVPNFKSSSPTLTSFRESNFFLEEIKDFLNDDSIPIEIENIVFDAEGDILLIEKLTNEDPCQLPLMDLKLAEESKEKSFIEEPPELELKELPSHLEYAFLEDSNKLPIIIAKNLKINEKEALINVLKSHKYAIAWKIFDIKGIDPRWFLGYFQVPIDPQDQEKTTFTCPYGTFAYRRMPFGLCNAPRTFQRCMMSIFHDMIEKTMKVFMDDFLVFGESFSSCLTNLDKILNRCEETNLVLNWEKCHFMCKEGIVLGHKISMSGIEVDGAKVDVIAKLPHLTIVKGVRSFLGHAGFYCRFIQDFSKIARPTIHLLKKETPFFFSKECIEAFNTLKKKITEAPILVVPDWNLPFELMCDASDYAIGVVLGQRKSKHDVKLRLLRWVLLLQEFDITILDKKGSENLAADHLSRLENPHLDVLENKDINENFPLMTLGSLPSHNTSWFADISNFHAGNFIKKGFVSLEKSNKNVIGLQIARSYQSKKLLKFSKLATTDLWEAIMVPISQRRRVMIKYGVTHRLATAYHPRTSGQVEVSNRGLKRILERTVGENRTLWSDKLDDALWAFRTAYKTSIGCTPCKLVYGKSCHLPIELEHRAYWALKHVNFDLKTAERTKKLDDSKIKNRIFNVDDQVFLFNSRLKIFSRKLKTRWSGPFTITRVFPYGTIELSQPNGPNFKVNGHRVKNYFGGDVPSNVAADLHTFPMDN